MVGGVATLAALAAASPAGAATFTVTSTSDPGPAGCVPFGTCTLRRAVEASIANGSAETDLIRFSVAGTIDLGSQLPQITTPVTIRGPGATSLTVRASNLGYRLFDILNDPAADDTRIEAMTLASADTQAAMLAGGAINNNGSGETVVEGVQLNFNKSIQGGAINNFTNMTVIDSSFVSNQSSGPGGAIFTGGGTSNFNITNSTIVGNSAAATGGGIGHSQGAMVIASSTLFFNRADSDDTGSQEGGGTFTSAGSATVRNTLYLGNRSADSPAPQDQCEGGYVSDGYNLRATDDSGCTGFTGPGEIGPPLPGTVLDGNPNSNGGQTLTVALVPGSPAIDAGNPDLPGSSGSACPVADQRGFPRGGPAGRCDIGAFEVQRDVARDQSPRNDFSFGALRRNKKKGTATQTVIVSGRGELALSGNGVRAATARGRAAVTVPAAGSVELPIRARGKRKRRLNRTGKAKLTIAVTFTPTGGTANTQSRKLKLKKR